MHPWSIAVLPDGKTLLVAEAGRIRVIRDGVLDPVPAYTVPAGTSKEIVAKLYAALAKVLLAPDIKEKLAADGAEAVAKAALEFLPGQLHVGHALARADDGGHGVFLP